MKDDFEIETDKASGRRTGITAERLNLIMAICAILISAASFYATYLQAESAEKQVKAMTLPLIQFGHGNWDGTDKVKRISFSLNNAGVGPAIIKSILISYNGSTYHSFNKFYESCCLPKLEGNDAKNKVEALTSPLVNSIIPGQTPLRFISIDKSKNDDVFWNNLNNERWKMTLRVCYCSMLGECYITEKNGIVDEVESCPIDLPKSTLIKN